jgi:hypothetical protein
MKEQDFSMKARLQQKAYSNDIYHPYGCRNPSLIIENSAIENHLKLA